MSSAVRSIAHRSEDASKLAAEEWRRMAKLGWSCRPCFLLLGCCHLGSWIQRPGAPALPLEPSRIGGCLGGGSRGWLGWPKCIPSLEKVPTFCPANPQSRAQGTASRKKSGPGSLSAPHHRFQGQGWPVSPARRQHSTKAPIPAIRSQHSVRGSIAVSRKPAAAVSSGTKKQGPRVAPSPRDPSGTTLHLFRTYEVPTQRIVTQRRRGASDSSTSCDNCDNCDTSDTSDGNPPSALRARLAFFGASAAVCRPSLAPPPPPLRGCGRDPRLTIVS